MEERRFLYTSDHARDRIQERCRINKASCDRIAKIAFENGLTHAEATGQLKAYITKVFNRNESANNIRIYAEKIWIFANLELVTVFPIPNNLKSQAIEQLKRKKKNSKGKKNGYYYKRRESVSGIYPDEESFCAEKSKLH